MAEKGGGELECVTRNRLIVHGKPVAAAVYSRWSLVLTPHLSLNRTARRRAVSSRDKLIRLAARTARNNFERDWFSEVFPMTATGTLPIQWQVHGAQVQG